MGLLQAVAAGLAGGAESMANNIHAEIAQERAIALEEARAMVQEQSKLRTLKSAQGMASEQAANERGRVGGLLSAGRETYDERMASQPGGYDPQDPQGMGRRSYEQLSTEEKAAVDRDTLYQSGDLDYAEKYGKFAEKEKAAFDSIKLDDGSVVSFNKATGQAAIAIPGSAKKTYKDIEEAIVNESDPARRKELIGIKTQIAAAGRSGGSEGQAPADVKAAEWIMSKGIAKNYNEAWEMVKMTKSDSPKEAIADIASKLLSGNPLKYDKDPAAAAREATAIYQAIGGGSSTDKPTVAPKSSNPQKAGKPFSVDNYF